MTPPRDPAPTANHHPLHPITRSLRARADTTAAKPCVTPLYHASGFGAGSPFFYTRKSNPNVVELEEALRTLEGAGHGVAVATGMAAIRVCLEQLRPGESMVVNRLIYGCSFRLFHRFCERFGVELIVRDLTSPEGVEQIPPSARLIFFETPTNPFLKTIDIARVVRAVRSRSRESLIVVDNKWATPLYQRPLEFGADVSLHSATKYLSGHSDVMGGILLTDRADLAEAFRAERFYAGAILDPHAAWLLRRSMQTLEVRLERQARTTREMRAFLADLPQVTRVYYPDIDGRQLTGYGGILFVELRADLADRVDALVSALDGFGDGTAMACVTSTVAQPYTGSHASMTAEEKQSIGLSPALVRLCFGLEHVDDLKRAVASGLAAIDPIAQVERPLATCRSEP